MQFYVPTLGDKIYLEEDWTFTLHQEGRNNVFAVKMGVADKRIEPHVWISMGKERTINYKVTEWKDKQATVTIPRGSCLIIDRIYIKGRNRDYDSITFRMDGSPNKRIKKGRFWVKLRDANKIKCSLYPVHDEEAGDRLKKLDQRFKGLELE